MPKWEKGQSGNPDGRLVEKPITDQIKLALNEYAQVDDGDEKGKKRKIKKLRLLAETIVDKACAGSKDHAALIFDRIEGKVKSEVDVTTAGQPLAFQSEALSSFAGWLAGSVGSGASEPAADVGSDGSVLPDPVRSGETRH